MNISGMGYGHGGEKDALQLLPKHMICNFHSFPSAW